MQGPTSTLILHPPSKWISQSIHAAYRWSRHLADFCRKKCGRWSELTHVGTLYCRKCSAAVPADGTSFRMLMLRYYDGMCGPATTRYLQPIYLRSAFVSLYDSRPDCMLRAVKDGFLRGTHAATSVHIATAKLSSVALECGRSSALASSSGYRWTSNLFNGARGNQDPYCCSIFSWTRQESVAGTH
jgi:hypothetical protein